MRNKIDEIFRSKLVETKRGYSPDLWTNIEAEIYPKKSDRVTGLWLMLLGALFLIPIFLLKDLSNATLNSNKKNLIVNHKTEINNSNTFKNENKSLQEKSNLNIAQVTKEALSNTHKITSGQNSGSKSNKKSHFSKDLDTAPINTTVFSRDLSEESSFKNKGERIRNKNLPFNLKPTTKQRKRGSFTIINIPSNSENLEKYEQFSSELLDPYRIVEEFPKLPISQITSPLNIKRTITPDYCDDRKRNPNKYYSEIYAGFGITPKSYEAINDDFNNYELLRSNSETPKISWNAGFSVGYQFANNLMLEGGFEYAQYNYELEYIDPNSIMTTTNITIDTIITPNMDTIVQTDTTTIQTFNLLTNTLRHQNLEIPLMIGMEFQLSPKLSLALKTGVSFNIYSQSAGYLLDAEGTAMNITSDGASSENQYFKSSFGVAIPLKAQVYYKVTPEIDLFGRVGMRYYNGSISTENFVIKDKIIYNNLDLGIRVQI